MEIFWREKPPPPTIFLRETREFEEENLKLVLRDRIFKFVNRRRKPRRLFLWIFLPWLIKGFRKASG